MLRSRALTSLFAALTITTGLGAGLTTPATARVEAAAADQAGDASADKALLAQLGGHATLVRHAQTGQLRFIGIDTTQPRVSTYGVAAPATAVAAGGAFLDHYGPLMGVTRGSRDLHVTGVQHSPRGSVVSYQQVYKGVPVLGGDLKVHTDRWQVVLAAHGEASPDLHVDITPTVGADGAATIARDVVARATGLAAAALTAARPSLWIYDPRLMGGPGLPYARLVWRTAVTDQRGTVDQFVAVDAHAGAVALRFDQRPAALTQRICDNQGKRVSLGDDSDHYLCDPADPRLVSHPGTSTVSDARKAWQATRATYDFYLQRFGRRSLDGQDLPLVSSVRVCPPAGQGSCPYDNAYWDGFQMVYGAGYATADDVVGHELTHGVTQFSSNLFYYEQTGAINEAMSDIMGEYIDQGDGLGTDTPAVRWRLGEDLPIGAIRDMKHPGRFGQPDRMTSARYTADPEETDSGGVHGNSGVANKAAYLLTDGGTFNGQVVVGLGIDKGAAIWYRVETSYLGTASDYADLGDYLVAACHDLVGSTPNDIHGQPSASGKVRAKDCAQVSKVVLATEMETQPPVAPAPRTSACSTGTADTTGLLDDSIDATGSSWSGLGSTWQVGSAYAHSGPYALHGTDRGRRGLTTLTLTSAVTIPASGATYLSFQHAYGFDDGSNDGTPNNRRYDGGVLEYSADGGAWTDAGPLLTFGGYNGRLYGTTQVEPLAGRRAFTAESNGYIMTKATLSSLKGQSVRLRFRIGSDAQFGDVGWFIDDIRIYQCH
jgi:bacillolysin